MWGNFATKAAAAAASVASAVGASHVFRIRRRSRIIIAVGLAVAFLAPALLGRIAPKVDDPPSPFWFVVQTFGGDWSAQRPVGISPYWFALLAELAVLLNVGALVVIIDLLVRVDRIKKEQDRMKLDAVTHVRDLSIRNSILAKVPLPDRDKIMRIVDEGFKEGDDVFKNQHLVTIFGYREAERVRDLLEHGSVDETNRG